MHTSVLYQVDVLHDMAKFCSALEALSVHHTKGDHVSYNFVLAGMFGFTCI